jgi:hypothetical protein
MGLKAWSNRCAETDTMSAPGPSWPVRGEGRLGNHDLPPCYGRIVTPGWGLLCRDHGFLAARVRGPNLYHESSAGRRELLTVAWLLQKTVKRLAPPGMVENRDP